MVFTVKDNIDSKISSGQATQGQNLIPIAGQIIPFAGTTAPSGWAICDGTNGTPDLRGYFLVGATAVGNIGATYGAAHSHNATFNSFTVTSTASSTTHDATSGAVSATAQAAHTHTVAVSYNSGSADSPLLANASSGNAVTFFSKPHSHTGSATVTYNVIATTGQHDHSGPSQSDTVTYTHATGHTVTAPPAITSATSTSYNPFMIMNYIMKL